MTRQRRIDRLIYKLSDFLTAMLAWAFFFFYRRKVEGLSLDFDAFNDPNFWFGIVLIPIGWILFYSIFDKYHDIYRMSRLATLTRTFFLTFIGVIFLFFTLILDDFVSTKYSYYNSFLSLFALHFLLTATARMILLTRASRRLKAGLVTYKTLIIGGDQNAVDLYEEITSREKGLGNNFIGFIDTNGKSKNDLSTQLPKLGKIKDITQIIKDQGIEEVIIAIETSQHNRLREILNILFDFDDQVLVKIIPDMYDIMLGTVQMNHVFGAVLIEIRQDLMPRWQRLVKRLIDFVVSLIMLILLSPLFIFVIIRVRLSSKGPILFKQERIGINGQAFWIYKFRSMYIDAEDRGPQLSSPNDDRCTPWGKVMRKWRI
ncbi:MAG TPA: sugar transferase, partial [Saprospiraceae bacterium]|nr:sugar transferase [Saprospiraceae bacterium]